MLVLLDCKGPHGEGAGTGSSWGLSLGSHAWKMNDFVLLSKMVLCLPLFFYLLLLLLPTLNKVLPSPLVKCEYSVVFLIYYGLLELFLCTWAKRQGEAEASKRRVRAGSSQMWSPLSLLSGDSSSRARPESSSL